MTTAMTEQKATLERSTLDQYFNLIELTAKGTTSKSKTRKRSLYECFNAKVKGDQIYCAKGNTLQTMGTEPLLRQLERGAPLTCNVCQDCPNFDRMGPPLRKNDRGYNGRHP